MAGKGKGWGGSGNWIKLASTVQLSSWNKVILRKLTTKKEQPAINPASLRISPYINLPRTKYSTVKLDSWIIDISFDNSNMFSSIEQQLVAPMVTNLNHAKSV